MRQVIGIISLAALLAMFGCSGGSSTTPSGRPSPPTTDGDSRPSATNGTVKPAAAGPGAITPENTRIEFTGTKQGGKHEGGFKKFSGSVKPSDADITKSTIHVEIDTTSIYTDDDGRMNKLTPHLKSPDFFDVAKYPTATFVSKEIKADKKDDTTHVITGDLTLHGTTKPVSIPVKVTTADDTLTIDGKVTIDRTQFGIAYNPQMVNKEVTIKVLAKVARK